MAVVLGAIATLAMAHTAESPQYQLIKVQDTQNQRVFIDKTGLWGTFRANEGIYMVLNQISENKGYSGVLSEAELRKLKSICFCESSNNPNAECYAGFQGGMGLCGFIPSTWNRTLKEMEKLRGTSWQMPERCYKSFTEYDKAHPIFDKECNMRMAEWLLKFGGDSHWDSSRSCWQKTDEKGQSK